MLPLLWHLSLLLEVVFVAVFPTKLYHVCWNTSAKVVISQIFVQVNLSFNEH